LEAITLVVPIYNEEGNIERIFSEVNKYRQQSAFPVFTLFVDDGSTDESLALIREICYKNQEFGFLALDSNRGLSAAIKAGFDYSTTEWVGYMDGDLQTSPMDFLKFEPFLGKFDLVMGERTDRKDGWSKRLSSSFANWLRNVFLNDGVKDSGCPLKIVNKSFFDKISYFNGFHRFFPALTQIHGGKIKVIQVQHFERKAGKSKFNTFNRTLQPLLDLLLVYRLKQRSLKYSVKESQVLKNLEPHE
jgi:glycosyltransferase involved in cell wall biosynthesis